MTTPNTTPRTDAALKEYEKTLCCGMVSFTFARQLETELNEAKAQLNAAADCYDTLHAYELIATLRTRQEELLTIALNLDDCSDCNCDSCAASRAKLTAFKEGMK